MLKDGFVQVRQHCAAQRIKLLTQSRHVRESCTKEIKESKG